MKKYQQQGDVLIGQITEIPKDAKKINTDVLQHGELTGHAHRLFDGEFEVLERPTGEKFLNVFTPTMLRHEEHHEQVIAPGAYRIGIVVETDPFEKMTRRVLD